MSQTFRAWHFTESDGRGGAVLRDGRPVVVGETLMHDEAREGKIVPCERGLHASVRAIDALNYAPGHMVSLCVMSGSVINHNDKIVSTERTPLFLSDAEDCLRKFARLQALSVASAWEMPSVVREYLETGDSALRSAAECTARNAAWSAARNAAWSASNETLTTLLLALATERGWES